MNIILFFLTLIVYTHTHTVFCMENNNSSQSINIIICKLKAQEFTFLENHILDLLKKPKETETSFDNVQMFAQQHLNNLAKIKSSLKKLKELLPDQKDQPKEKGTSADGIYGFVIGTVVVGILWFLSTLR